MLYTPEACTRFRGETGRKGGSSQGITLDRVFTEAQRQVSLAPPASLMVRKKNRLNMRYDELRNLVWPCILLSMMACSQEKAATNNKCCQKLPRTVGWTTPNENYSDSGTVSVADLSVDPVATIVTERMSGAVDSYRLHVRITNEGSQCTATCNKAIITLPTETKVIEVITDAPWKQCYGYLEVDVRKLCPRRPGDKEAPKEGLLDRLTGDRYWYSFEFDVDVKDVTRREQRNGNCMPAFGVHVFGNVPDQVPSNNYWWWYKRCVGSDVWEPNETKWGPQP